MENQIPNLVSVQPTKLNNKLILPGIVVIALSLGVLTGYLLTHKNFSAGNKTAVVSVIEKDKITKGGEFGVKDTSAFKDTTIGTLESGGLDTEGTHKLIREGGPSQTVYLTSSILDLEQFVGKKVQVWGATMNAQKAGWLMDIGKVKILE